MLRASNPRVAALTTPHPNRPLPGKQFIRREVTNPFKSGVTYKKRLRLSHVSNAPCNVNPEDAFLRADGTINIEKARGRLDHSCRLGRKCQASAPTRTVEAWLSIRPSQIHGLGLFALQDIAKETPLGPYTGKIVRHGVDARVQSDAYAFDVHGTSFTYDALLEGNYLRHVNHANRADNANVVAIPLYRVDLVRFEGEPVPVILYVTTKDTSAGSELLLDYGNGGFRNGQ